MSKHDLKIGETVIIGKGAHVWRITGFFGEFNDIADLQRVDLASSNTSARFDRLVRVTP